MLITDKLDKTAEAELKKGGSVSLAELWKDREKGSKDGNRIFSIFWNTAWTNNQPPHTLGILM